VFSDEEGMPRVVKRGKGHDITDHTMAVMTSDMHKNLEFFMLFLFPYRFVR